MSLSRLGLAPGVIDRRADFRRVFCETLEQSLPDRRCEGELWHLVDEPDDSESWSELTANVSDVRPLFVLVGGAFAGCFGDDSVAWPDIDASFDQLGMDFLRAEVVSRSSSDANSQLIREQSLERAGANQPIVLIGYSKGLVDSLTAVAGDPEFASRVQAVVGIAGPYAGSALANMGAAPYKALFDESFAGHCHPGDGGVLGSLTVDALEPLGDLPQRHEGIRFYSVAAWPTSARLAWLLEPATQVLAVNHPANDGQVGVPEALLSGVHLLGVVNADHWGAALPIEEGEAGLFSNTETTQFPRDELLLSVAKFVLHDMESTGVPGGGE